MSVWSPVEIDFSKISFEEDIASLKKKESFIKRYYYGFIAGIIVVLMSSFLWLAINQFPFFILFIILSFFLFVWLHASILSLKKGLIKLKVAEKNKWVYSPARSTYLFSLFSQRFKRFFYEETSTLRSRRYTPFFEHVFWGAFDKQTNSYDFMAGDFNYYVERSSGKDRSIVRYTDHFFIVRMRTDIKGEFRLYSKNIASRITNFFFKQNIVTESIDFNNSFSFSYQNNDSETKVDIMSVLSPVVIEDLVSFYKVKAGTARSMGGARILFEQECIVFTAPGSLLPNKKGLRLSSLDVSEEDTAVMQDRLDLFFELASKLSTSLTNSEY